MKNSEYIFFFLVGLVFARDVVRYLPVVDYCMYLWLSLVSVTFSLLQQALQDLRRSLFNARICTSVDDSQWRLVLVMVVLVSAQLWLV